ncbi:hypothetical protein H6G97_36600 [Nostoc flagelliforme FACHB-838]|uniref:Transposase n=1 Tax=Nostoc flagelliforme FACHB-838 TaxID=2692904 RepID=A0ABR8E0R4_9NOSO|nr:hypothetical protein [Nostoc flagelliforme FACHB-838]
MVFRRGLSKGNATGKSGYTIAISSWRLRDRNQSGNLFAVFGVASSTYINETRVQQPLVSPNYNTLAKRRG